MMCCFVSGVCRTPIKTSLMYVCVPLTAYAGGLGAATSGGPPAVADCSTRRPVALFAYAKGCTNVCGFECAHSLCAARPGQRGGTNAPGRLSLNSCSKGFIRCPTLLPNISSPHPFRASFVPPRRCDSGKTLPIPTSLRASTQRQPGPHSCRDQQTVGTSPLRCVRLRQPRAKGQSGRGVCSTAAAEVGSSNGRTTHRQS